MSPRSLHTVTAPDGTQIAWHFHEAGAPVKGLPAAVLTNGIGTTENFWRHLVADLTIDRRVAHWDYRAHGKSQLSASGDYSLKTHAEDLARVTEAVMARTGGKPPVQIAFSMGVTVLLELYRARPELVPAMGSVDRPTPPDRTRRCSGFPVRGGRCATRWRCWFPSRPGCGRCFRRW